MMIEKNTVFRIENGVLTKYEGEEKKVTVPEGVLIIGEWAFADNKTVECVKIPEGVETIRHLAFSHCTALKEVHLPQSLRKIGHHAFYDCVSLQSIRLPENLLHVEAEVFANCPALADQNGFILFHDILYQYVGKSPIVRIPEGIRTIAPAAFAQNKTLREIVLPTSLREIGDRAFFHCSDLQSIFVPDGVERIGDMAFSSCGKMTLGVIPKSAQKIGNKIFQYSSFLLCALILSDHGNYRALDSISGMNVFNLSESDHVVALSERKTDAVVGCAVLKEMIALDIPENAEKNIRSHIKKHRQLCYPYLEKQPYFLQYMLKQRLIPQNDIITLIEQTQNVEIRAVLLQYQNETMTPQARAKLEAKEKNELEKLFSELNFEE